MISGRLSLAIVLALGLAVAAPTRTFAQTPAPVATIQGLCDALVQAMKQGPALGFAGRRQLLEPQIRKALDLPRMTRLAIGPPWRGLSEEQQGQLVAAFSEYSINTYASEFSAYSGQSFAVDPAPTHLENGTVIVHTTLSTGDPEPVKLDYLMREDQGSWKVIDVFLNGTISQLAARRSEYTSVLRRGGVEALVSLLRSKAGDLTR